jgi:hypothetical protein
MSKGYKVFLPVLILALALSLGGMIACGEKPSEETQAPAESNDSVVTGKLVAARVLTEAFPWEIDIEIYDSQDVAGYANLTKEKIGQVITARTHEYPLGFSVGQAISAHVKLEDDEGGSYYYAWDVH